MQTFLQFTFTYWEAELEPQYVCASSSPPSLGVIRGRMEEKERRGEGNHLIPIEKEEEAPPHGEG